MSLLVTDPDSGVSTRYIACEDCGGFGFEEIGEVEDEIICADCHRCNGTGLIEIPF